MTFKVDDLVLRLEAVLFASGKPLSVKELGEALSVEDGQPVQAALRTLMTQYDDRSTALEVRHVGDRYALKVREEFVGTAQPITPVDIPPRTLKTLTLIAYHQPVKQSVLARMMGDSAYQEVQRLKTLGFVHTEPSGATFELRTTHQFAEYFGLPAGRADEIRSLLVQRLGVLPSAPPGASGIPLPTLPGEAPPEPSPEALKTVPVGAEGIRPPDQNDPQ